MLEVAVSADIDGSLIGLLLILGGNCQCNIPAVNDLAEWAEPFLVEVDVIGKINKQLRGPGVGSSRSIGERSFEIRHLHRIVKNVGVLPLLGNRSVTTDAKLRHKSGDNTEEAGVVVVAAILSEQLVQAIHAMWRI